jgi:alkylation response protein AidB-like acyl-CoA dehydrogenase
MSWRGVHLGGFRLNNYEVPDDHILGEPGKGFDAMIATVNSSRLRQGASCTGFASYVLDAIGEHVVNRKTFGQRLGDHQAITFMLADRDLEVDLSRLLVERGAYLGDHLGTNGITANDFRLAMGKAKLYATETLARVVDSAVQLFGAAGITRDLPVERWYRDARVYRISEGSVEMQRIQLGRAFMARYEDQG